MKSRVELSNISSIITITVLLILVCGFFFTADTDKFVIYSVIVIALLIFSLWYCPLTISADEKNIYVLSPLRIHSIPMRRVVSVERFSPTMMCSIRLCASGGFLGYWGIFKEGDVGTYFGYYGKSTQCFLMKLDNGDKFVLGCKDTQAMVDYINSIISK